MDLELRSPSRDRDERSNQPLPLLEEQRFTVDTSVVAQSG
jgi:hypothetical protein